MTVEGWKRLDIAVIGGGIGGQAAATALRRQGHKVTIYERADFVGEVGASISCAANGTKWLEKWNVNIELGDPVVLKNLISRDWGTGEPINVYDLSDYKEQWGYVSQRNCLATIRNSSLTFQTYYMFHRQYMHRMLKDSATNELGEGTPVKLVLNHKVSVVPLSHINSSQSFNQNFRRKMSTLKPVK